MIDLTPQQLERVEILAAAGALDVQHGRVEVDLHNGQIQAVRVEEVKYRRQKLSTAPHASPKHIPM